MFCIGLLAPFELNKGHPQAVPESTIIHRRADLMNESLELEAALAQDHPTFLCACVAVANTSGHTSLPTKALLSDSSHARTHRLGPTTLECRWCLRTKNRCHVAFFCCTLLFVHSSFIPRPHWQEIAFKVRFVRTGFSVQLTPPTRLM